MGLELIVLCIGGSTMNSKRTKQLMLQCQIEMEQQRKEEREEIIIGLLGITAMISLVFIFALILQ